jgi:WD40 repeat protein
VNSVSLNGDGRLALSGSDDKTVKLWAASSGHCLHTFQEHAARVRAVCLSTDGWLALSGSADKTVNLWFLDWELGDEPLPKAEITPAPRNPF